MENPNNHGKLLYSYQLSLKHKVNITYYASIWLCNTAIHCSKAEKTKMQ